MASLPQNVFAATVSADQLTALQQSVAHFDREQLIWSSGFLAGLAGSTAPQAATAYLQPVPEVQNVADTWHVFYATETGNSRQVAEELRVNAKVAGLAVEVHDLKTTRPKFLKTVGNAVFILATHGIGEPPEGSEAFFEFWQSDKAPRLKNLQYSVLALGDSSYADFCEAGRRFDERLLDLGATAVVDRVDCDLDFDSAASIWTHNIVEHARETTNKTLTQGPAHLAAVATSPAFSKQNPFRAEVLTRQRITGRGSSKNVQHVELDLEGSQLAYQPGDSLAILPTNPPQLVDELVSATNASADSFAGKEITALSRPLLDLVARSHPELRTILDDRERFAQFLATCQLTDLVHEFPVDWQDARYQEALRKLSPRSYSIASSPDANPDEAHLTVAIVDYEKFGRRHWGAASNFLAGDATHVPAFIERNENFRLPSDGDTPIIMVGAGTGIAPYRAFVEHRREHGHNGDNWLVFGDRTLSSDFLYQLEWLRYRKDGLLTTLDVAFSRDQSEKIYVQHRLLEKGAAIYAWLEKGAHFYVCGDATKMAGDVHDALVSIVSKHADLSIERAQDYVKNLARSGRYQRDVY